MVFGRLKMRGKLLVLSIIGIVGMLIIGAMSVMDLKDANEGLGELSLNMHNIAKYNEMKNRILLARIDSLYLTLLEDPVKLKEKHDDFELQITTIRKLIRESEGSQLKAEEKQLLLTFKDGLEAYATQAGKLSNMILSAQSAHDKVALAAAFSFGVSTVAPLYKKPADTVDALNKYYVTFGDDLFNSANSRVQGHIYTNLAFVVAFVIISVLLAMAISKAISSTLSNVLQTMIEIANGNLTVRTRVTSRDEMGMLNEEMNAMSEKLSGIVKQLSSNSHSVSAAATHMHSTSQNMSISTEQLAAQAATIATACEEMSATSSDIARTCHMAAEDAVRANEAAKTGAEVVENTVTVMGKIAERVRAIASTVETLGIRSEQIGQIVGTIEDIADQTNLLALNAAIEAARAGEQGRGFAVVADEVRALAVRTTKATREIGEMIKSIQGETKNAVQVMDEGVKQVEVGTAEAARSGESLVAILGQINSLADQVNQIAVAAEEQTAAICEINSNIQHVTDVAHMTSASSRDEALAADNLSGLAEELDKVVAQFRV